MTETPGGLLVVVNAENCPFNVRLVRTGDGYGLDDCLTHGDAMYGRPANPDALPMIEFYDASASEKFGPRGQFVSRYGFEAIGATVREARGILLHGAHPQWSVSAANVREAFTWAAEKAARN